MGAGSLNYVEHQSINLPKPLNPFYVGQLAQNRWDTRKGNNKLIDDPHNEVLRRETDIERKARRQANKQEISRYFSGSRFVNVNLADDIRSEYRKHDMKYNRAIKHPDFAGNAKEYMMDPIRKGAASNWGLNRAGNSIAHNTGKVLGIKPSSPKPVSRKQQQLANALFADQQQTGERYAAMRQRGENIPQSVVKPVRTRKPSSPSRSRSPSRSSSGR